MQPSDLQVERSIAALLLDPPDRARSEPLVEPQVTPRLALDATRRIAAVPRVRPERVAAARARLAGGDVPSAEEVAGKLVARLVCDRLR